MKRKLIYTLTGSILTTALIGNASTVFAQTINDLTQYSEQESAYTEELTNDSAINTQESNDVSTEGTTDIDSIKVGEDFYISGDIDNVTVNDSTVVINSGGTYTFSGTLNDGQIIVDSSDDDKVKIIFDGTNINCSDNSPIYVKNADKTTIILNEGTENIISDGEAYIYEDETSDEPSAAIYSKDDLVIDGEGSLVVNGNYKDGIVGKDDLKIKNGNITVNAIANGIKGKDSLIIVDGNVTINAGADGMKSTNDTNTEKGYILIENGTFNITSAEDAIQADNYVTIKDGYFSIISGGGNEMNNDDHHDKDAPPDWDMGNFDPSQMGGRPDFNGTEGTGNVMAGGNSDDSTSTDDESISTKGIKAEKNITIDGGTFDIDACDDGLHSNGSIIINNGDINIKSGDDGIHADYTLDINDGNILIAKSYEALEAGIITINGGNINVTASDDGMNASGDTDENIIYVNGGYTVVNADGDGLDANGSIYMTDGTMIVNGPVMDNNGAIDYDGTFKMSGGLLIAAGSSGMAQSVSESSTQNCVTITLTSQKADTLVHIENEDKDEVITYAPAKEFNSVVVCSPKLQTGSTYRVYIGGSYDGEEKDGLYSNGTYVDGEEVGSFTVSSINSRVTQEGASNGNRPGGNRPGGMNPPGKPGGMTPPDMSGSEIVDKSSLQSLYDEHKDDTNEIYTTYTWNIFIDALSNAKSVLENIYASQSDVDNAYTTLNTAINNLEKDNSSNADTDDSLDNGSLSLTTSLNSWEGGYIISFDIKNISDETINKWSLKIKKENLDIVDHWCVNLEDSGDYIIITPEEWNSSLTPGQTINFGIQGTGTGSTDFSYELISE
ncbi:MAG: carbohydrate-binding domain-containing protein [Clostridium sp.]